MSLDSLYPYAGDHAIQNAVFAVEFDGVLSPTILRDLQKAAEKGLLKEFPNVTAQQTFNVNLDFGNVQSGNPQPFKAAQTPGGFLMTRASSFAPVAARTITVNLNSCLIVVNDYSRWINVAADVDRYLDVLLKAAQSHNVAVRAIGLQYTDVFNWKSDPADLILSEVFDRTSPYLAPNIFTLPNEAMWHSHHGYFSSVELPVRFKQLNNVNVNKLDVGGMVSLQVLTSHRAQLDAPLWKISRDNRPVISAIQELLHQSNKSIVGSLLTADVKAKIKLS